MRTLALYWPTLSRAAGGAGDDRSVRLRSARHALGRLSPLVAGSDSYGLIEIGIDGLQARSGSERDIAAIALRAVGVHLRERPSAAVSSSRLLAVLLARGGVGGDVIGRRLLLTMEAGPRTGATAVVDVYEGRGARADLRISRLPIEEVACAPLRSTGQH